MGHDTTMLLYKNTKRRRKIGNWIDAIVIAIAIVLLAWLFFTLGCQSGRGTYTTLASTEQAVVLSYDGYLDSVIRGETKTNDLPLVAKSFDAFQASMRLAVDRASGNTNAPITGDLSTAAANLIQQIQKSKGK